MDLAQYRDVASFAQLTSDLDEATLRQLHRGERLAEVLKQPQNAPMPVEKEVCILWAPSTGTWTISRWRCGPLPEGMVHAACSRDNAELVADPSNRIRSTRQIRRVTEHTAACGGGRGLRMDAGCAGGVAAVPGGAGRVRWREAAAAATLTAHDHPLLVSHGGRMAAASCVVIFGSDRGLCGGFTGGPA
jgi:hypothetical protein